jgi:hypothetical protein
MRLRPIKRDFFRAGTTIAVFTPKTRPTRGGLRSDCCQESLSRNLRCYPWSVVAQFDMLPMQAGEEHRCWPRGKRQVKPRCISTVESLNRHKGKEEIEPLQPLHRDKTKPAQAELGFFPGNILTLRERGSSPLRSTPPGPRCGFSPSMRSWRFPLFNERSDGCCYKGGKLVEN